MKKSIVYGYARVSTKSQKLERQIDNISKFNPKAIIFTEKYTGTKIEGRKELDKLLKKVKEGDTIIFDSVSRMSRDSEEGTELYFYLYEKGVNLVFLKERHIDTETYKKALETSIPMTNTIADTLLKGVNDFLKELAKEQIKIAFDQAEKEVQDTRQRIKEGIAKSEKTQGIKEGTKLITKKSILMKDKMKRHLKEFGGTDTDIQFMTENGLARNTFYKYKRELKSETV
jgi:DNA invertase Pin-like site-specific DNA recombinase